MSAALAARIARRELRGGLHGFRIFLACLILGVAAIAAVGSVRSAIEAGLAEKGAELLGGDAQAEFTYRFATDEERAWLEAEADRVSEIVDFRSMAVTGDGGAAERALTRVKAVDGAYPLLGEIVLDPPQSLEEALSGRGAVMAPALADRLGLTPGDEFRLGSASFRLSAIIVTEPDDASGGLGLGPRTIVYTADLQGSGLLSTGSLFETEYRLDLPEGANLDDVREAALSRYEDAGLSWRDARNGAPGIARFTERLGGFLILVGLAGLAVGGIGVSSAVRTYLARKTGVIATLRTLGATRDVIFLTYFFQIGALSLLGVALGLIAGAAMPVLLGPVISGSLPVPALFTIYPAPLAEAAIYGVLTALLFTLWPLARAESIPAATLFRDALQGARTLPARRYLIATALIAAILAGVAMLFSGNPRLTIWTLGGVLGALIALSGAAMLVRFAAQKLAKLARGRPVLRWALSAIGGPGESAGAVVLSVGLGLTVLAAVGQIDGNLRAAIDRDLPKVARPISSLISRRIRCPAFLSASKAMRR